VSQIFFENAQHICDELLTGCWPSEWEILACRVPNVAGGFRPEARRVAAERSPATIRLLSAKVNRPALPTGAPPIFASLIRGASIKRHGLSPSSANPLPLISFHKLLRARAVERSGVATRH